MNDIINSMDKLRVKLAHLSKFPECFAVQNMNAFRASISPYSNGLTTFPEIKYCGIRIVVDPELSEGCIEVRNAAGEVLERINFEA